jgi:hypothetical protein
MAVSTRLRYEILRRDGHTCQYCGATVKLGASLEIDHILPKVLGGTDVPSNLVTACRQCNSGKGSTHPHSPLLDETVEQDALRWWKATRRAGEKLAADRKARQQAHQEFAEAWNRWSRVVDGKQTPIPLPTNWQTSIDQLTLVGVPLWLLLDRIPDVMQDNHYYDDKRFRHLCDIGWMHAKDITYKASQIIEKGDDDPDPWATAPNRQALSLMFLGRMFSEGERRKAFGDAEAVDEERENAEQRAISALWFAISNLQMDRACMEGSLRTLLDALPDRTGIAAVERARIIVGPSRQDDETHVLPHAAHVAAEGFNLQRAEDYLRSLPAGERERWITEARSFYAASEWAMDEASYIIAAAELASGESQTSGASF